MNKEQPLFKGEQIKELIPQREPIVMMDVLYAATENSCITGLTILPENIFCEDNLFTEPGLIEHIAQSASAFAGYNARQKGLPAPVGFIGEVKKYKTLRKPEAGKELITTINILSEVMNVSLLSAETTVDNQLVASCQMKIFIKEDE
jgi:3-hydroxymyristoyl/3-hydroxydecanoyl-(acyl carrier protein) dehydratase